MDIGIGKKIQLARKESGLTHRSRQPKSSLSAVKPYQIGKMKNPIPIVCYDRFLVAYGSERRWWVSLIFIWGLIPILTFVESLLIGVNGYWSKLAWIAVPVLGLGLMLTEFFTFEAANHMTFGNTNYPDPYLLLVGTAISAFGIGVGKRIFCF